jgi:hypothetical protein
MGAWARAEERAAGMRKTDFLLTGLNGLNRMLLSNRSAAAKRARFGAVVLRRGVGHLIKASINLTKFNLLFSIFYALPRDLSSLKVL